MSVSPGAAKLPIVTACPVGAGTVMLQAREGCHQSGIGPAAAQGHFRGTIAGNKPCDAGSAWIDLCGT